MASKFQSRLIGTIIVVAIGVIILPDVFDGKKERYTEEFATIPLKPELEQTESENTAKDPKKAQDLEGVEASKPTKEELAEKAKQRKDDDIAEGLAKSQSENETEQESAQTSEAKIAAKKEAQAKEAEKLAASKAAEEAAKKELAAKKAKEAAAASKAAEFKDNAWIIQLVALKNKENADKLAADLKQKGYQAHVKAQGNVSRVLVGPDLSREKMLEQIKTLEGITGLKGQLRKFKPMK